MAPQPHFPLPLPKHWPRRVRSAAVHAIALARLALTTARYPAGTTFPGAGLPPAGTTDLSRHTWTTTGALLLNHRPVAAREQWPWNGVAGGRLAVCDE